MKRGIVTEDREILVQLEILAADDSLLNLEAIVDTGFDGYLTLPVSTINFLQAVSAGTRRAAMADGSITELAVFQVRINWHGQEREILALQADAQPLIGMSMLWDSRVTFDAQQDGIVRITKLRKRGRS